MKIAITGASGFLGRHVLAALKRAHIRPTVLVRNLPAFVCDDVDVANFDLRHPPVDAFTALGRPDVLIHLAWGGLPHYGSLHHFEQEAPAHYSFLKMLVTSGLQHVVVSGTCFEYGMRSGPLDESVSPEPANPYGLAKMILHQQLLHLQHKQAFSLTWARFFYLYGEGQAPNSLFAQLKTAVAKNVAAFDMSGGEQLRDYLPVEKAAADLVALALLRKNTGAVNLCSGRPIAVRTLVENWIRENQWNIKLNLGHHPYPLHEPMAFWGRRDRLDQLLSHA